MTEEKNQDGIPSIVYKYRDWSLNNDRNRLGTAQIGCRGRSASASGLTLPSPANHSLCTSIEKVFLHHSAVQFSTGTLCNFHPVFTIA